MKSNSVRVNAFKLAKAVLHIKFGEVPPDELIEHFMWEHTGYPAFWSKEDGRTPHECFENQLWKI